MTARSPSSGVSMDVLSILRLVVRHWRVTAPAALLTLVGVGAVFKSSSPTYEATGAVVLLSPPEAPEVNDRPETAPPPEVGQNPFARYGDLSVVADILARVMDSDSRRVEFESQGVTDYNVVVNRLQRGPVVDVTGQGPTPEAATQSTEIVLEEVDSVLSELQQAEHADPDYYIKAALLEPPSSATAMYGSTVRAAIAALAVGTLGTLGLAVIAEAVARRWRVLAGTGAEPDVSDATSSDSEGGASNGAREARWAAIVPTLLPLARRTPSQEEAALEERSKGEPRTTDVAQGKRSRHDPSKRARVRQKTAQQDRSKQESALGQLSTEELAQTKPSKQDVAPGEPEQRESSTREPVWQTTFQQEPPGGFLADYGHRRATTDRSP
jgi:hypothetical protein